MKLHNGQIASDLVSMLGKTTGIRERMNDELSKKLYNMRLKYALYRNENAFLHELSTIDDLEWRFYELDYFSELNKDIQYLVIFGGGEYGKHTFHFLKRSKYRDYDIIFCDNSEEVRERLKGEGYNVISPQELLVEYRKGIVIIANKNNKIDIYNQLKFYVSKRQNYPIDRIVLPALGLMIGFNGKQYFDFFKPGDNEIFIDAGSQDGDTSASFIEWADGKYKKIYVFEPNPYCKERCENTFKIINMKNVKFIEKAVWNKAETLSFHTEFYSGGARVDQKGDYMIQADTIDNCIAGDKATFIKMDVEGAEYEALVGAQETIRKYKPKLAISLYHKPLDVLEIPELLLSLRSDYKFGLRHYSSTMLETVLYAY